MSGWRLAAKVRKDRFLMGERVLLELEAVFAGPGRSLAPVLAGARPGSPALEVKRDSGTLERVTTEVFDLSVATRYPATAEVSKGVPVRGALDLGEWVKPLAAGAYEVVVELPEHDARSEPVRFVVERLRARAFAASARDDGRDGPRSVLYVDDVPPAPRLALAVAGDEAWIAKDLAPVARDARVLLAATAPGTFAERRWVVAIEGDKLRRIYVEGARVVELGAATIDLPAPLVLGACAGASSLPPPPGIPPIPDPEGAVRGTWPALHVAFAGRRERRAQLVGWTLRPEDEGPPRADTLTLLTLPFGGLVLAVAPDRRRVLVVREERGLTLLEAIEWTAAGFGKPRTVLSSAGRFISLDGMVDEAGEAKVALLVGHGPASDEVELLEAGVGAEGDGLPGRSLRAGLDQLPPGVSGLRVRMGAGGRAHVLGEQAPPGRPVLLELGKRAMAAIDSVALPWDVELEGPDVGAFVLSPDLGITRRAFPALVPAAAHHRGGD